MTDDASSSSFHLSDAALWRNSHRHGVLERTRHAGQAGKSLHPSWHYPVERWWAAFTSRGTDWLRESDTNWADRYGKLERLAHRETNGPQIPGVDYFSLNTPEFSILFLCLLTQVLQSVFYLTWTGELATKCTWSTKSKSCGFQI